MARIPEGDIERLKNEVSVERLVESAGIALKKVGKDMVGLCPFHDDHDPSLRVTPTTNLWRCPSCGVGGGPIDWVMKLRGISFRHAAELLLADPSLAAGSVTPVKRTTVPTLPAPVAFDADKQALLNQTIGYYHTTLQQSPEALAYLQERGLTHPELIDHFRLGYANRTLGLRLPQKNRVAGGEIRTRLQDIGIYRDSGHEHFNGSLIVPVIDASGNVTEVYGRKIREDLRKGTPSHLYLPGPHRGVWNEAALIASKEIILCEALIDAMTFWCAGYRNVTASYGADGFTDDHLAAFKTHAIERVLIAYDRDEAGERGAEKVAAQLMAHGIDCFRIQFPKNMDANDYALKVQPAAKSLGILIRQASWLGKGKPPVPAIPAPVIPSPTPSPSPEAQTIASVADSAPSSLAADVVVASCPLPATPVPAASHTDIPYTVSANEIRITLGDRCYRVRGLSKNQSYLILKINLLVSSGVDDHSAFYVDTFDLYNIKQRESYATHAAVELQIKEGIIKNDLGRVLRKLEDLQEEQIQAALKPKAPDAVTMDAAEREAAMTLLRDSRLIERLLADCTTCGLIGEDTNKLVGYLACVSRKLDKPLGIVIQSSSAAGKTSLMDAILAFVPPEDKVKYSAMTGQSLFYMGATNLKHKALAIVEEEGASRASYALKLLQSEGELTMASTGKDAKTGELGTQLYRVEGPVALLITTTARDVDEELMNRCLVLAVDESRDQTRAIHRLQRERRTLEGLAAKREKESLIALHQNAQRLLKKIDVLNPFAQYLTFPDQTTRLRRDHEKYLTLIDTITFLHQHQREVKTTRRNGQDIDYIEVTLDDIALANKIAHEVLGRSLDELPPQTRRLLKLIDQYVSSECEKQALLRADLRFSRKALRDTINLSDTQLRLHLERLVQMEYLLVHRGTRGQSYEYELLYDGRQSDANTFVTGLIDIDHLKTTLSTSTTASSRGKTGEFAPPARGQRAPNAVGSRGDENEPEPALARDSLEVTDKQAEMHALRANGKSPSYLQAPVVPSHGQA